MTFPQPVAPPGWRAPGHGHPTQGPLRWARGAVVGLSATCLAYGGHVAAGGVAPSAGPLALTCLVAVLVAIALSSSRWTLAPLLSMLLGAQVVLHVAFAAPVPSAVFGGSMAHGRMGLPMGADLSAGSSVTGMTGMTGTTMSGHHGWLMVASHVLAAVLSALLLRRGEEWSWRLLDLVIGPIRGAFALQLRRLPSPPRRVPAPTSAVPVAVSRLLRDVQSRRGPPQAYAG